MMAQPFLARDLRIKPIDVFIDPPFPVERAIITHGHGDHARSGHGAVLATPDTVATTFPVVAPEGTVTPMLVSLQLVTLAVVPLNATELVPCVDPKLVPVIVTAPPTTPEVADKLVMVGPDA